MIPEQLFEPQPHDSSAVSEALHSARAALSRGEPREALRLARQAAEAAESDGDDPRALGLARAAADLANELGGSVAPPPTPSPQPPSSYLPPSASQAPPPESQAPPSAAQAPPPESHAPPPASQAPPPESHSPQPAPSPSVAVPSSPSSGPKSTAQSLEPQLDALLASGRAVRVLVKRSARDEELYVVRRPVSGKPAFDAREALIVLLEPDPDFFGGK